LNILERCKEILSGVSDSPESEAKILIEEVMGKSFNLVYRERMNDEELNKIENFLNLRVKERIPLQYITGKSYFFDLELKIRKGVFIPRPETEVIVDTLLKKKDINEHFLFLDIGTGSGNISITVLKHFEKSRGIATDISKEAISLAKENALMHRVIDRLHFIVMDGLKGLREYEIFDVILSNPPYIPTDVIYKLSPEVKREPKIAINGGRDGMKFIERFLFEGFKILKKKGLFLIEVGPETHQKAFKLAVSLFENVEMIKDFYGKPRVIEMIK